MNNSAKNGAIGRNSGLGAALPGSLPFKVFEIAVVFSPVLIVILGFRILNLREPLLMIAGVWVAYIFMLAAIWLSIYLRGETGKSIGLSFDLPTLNDALWTVLKSIGILVFAVLGFALGSIVMANNVGIPEAADMSKYNYLKGNLPLLLLSLAGVYFVSSFGEEVVFRGFLITRLESMLGGKTRGAIIGSLVLSSVVFGFAHFEWGALGIAQTGLMGLALGISFYLTKRNLWPLIIAHGYLDTLLLVQLYLA